MLVHVLPQVYFYGEKKGQKYLEQSAGFRALRAVPILLPLLVGAGIAGSAALGASALIMEDKNFKELSAQIDVDIEDLQQSVAQLEEQVDSLAEVVLQNKRGLDLLFMDREGYVWLWGKHVAFMLIGLESLGRP